MSQFPVPSPCRSDAIGSFRSIRAPNFSLSSRPCQRRSLGAIVRSVKSSASTGGRGRPGTKAPLIAEYCAELESRIQSQDRIERHQIQRGRACPDELEIGIELQLAGLNRVGIVNHQWADAEDDALRQQHQQERCGKTRVHIFALHGAKSR